MTCNCKGKTPPSVALRLQCAFVAAQATSVDLSIATQRAAFPDLIEKTYDAVRGQVTTEELDTGPEDGAIAARAERAALLWKPISVLSLREPLVNDLEDNFGAKLTVGGLVQIDRRMGGAIIVALTAALSPHGLRLAMSLADIKQWIDHGVKEEASEG